MKEERALHIISFNIPYPPDYGGVIDIYYKLKALHESGVRIILHNYQYGRAKSDKLEEFCGEVYYYPRNKTPGFFLKKLPFIVATRNSSELLSRIQRDSHPVLFEGIHSTRNISDLAQGSRKLIIRAHNIEHNYYAQLAKYEKKIWRKLFFYSESIKLAYYEKRVLPLYTIASISPKDHEYLTGKYHNSKLVSAFHSFESVNIKPGIGSHILYHGNLSVPENIKAATFLLKNIFPAIPYPCIIAGKQPDKSLFKLASGISNVKIIADPDQMVMDDLLANAQINLLPAFQDSGMKLKLLAALFRGKHCLVNSTMVANTELAPLCHLAESIDEIIVKAKELVLLRFENSETEKRKAFLNLNYNNHANAERLIQLIWPD
jgi:hypothetical protein